MPSPVSATPSPTSRPITLAGGASTQVTLSAYGLFPLRERAPLTPSFHQTDR
jgi:hypothetical protein